MDVYEVEPMDSSVDLELLARHSSSRIRAVLAASDKTPADVLRMLASDHDTSVKLAAALNPTCPLDILESLSVDTDWSVRLGLATQLDVCEEILRALLTHRNPYLAAQSRHALNALELERKLRELNITFQSGSDFKLGELLVAANLISMEQLMQSLELARAHDLLLGRVLIQAGIVSSAVIIEALRLQGLLRRNAIEMDDAVVKLSQTNGDHSDV